MITITKLYCYEDRKRILNDILYELNQNNINVVQLNNK